jgi:hypothetical protein
VRRCIDVHLLNLTDGSPYRVPPSNVTRLSCHIVILEVDVGQLAITGSRLMMYVTNRLETSPHAGEAVGRILVWDWRTGDLVRVLRHGWLFFTHFFSGARHLIREWETIGRV